MSSKGGQDVAAETSTIFSVKVSKYFAAHSRFPKVPEMRRDFLGSFCRIGFTFKESTDIVGHFDEMVNIHIRSQTF